MQSHHSCTCRYEQQLGAYRTPNSSGYLNNIMEGIWLRKLIRALKICPLQQYCLRYSFSISFLGLFCLINITILKSVELVTLAEKMHAIEYKLSKGNKMKLRETTVFVQSIPSAYTSIQQGQLRNRQLNVYSQSALTKRSLIVDSIFYQS